MQHIRMDGGNVMNHSLLLYATRLRSYLVLLQLMFVVLYGFHLKLPLPGFDVGVLIFLAVCTLLVLTLPAAQLAGPWCIGLLAMADGSILFGAMPDGPQGVEGITAMFLLLAMASYMPSILHFVLVSSLLILGYGISLYRVDVLQSELVLLIPSLLSVTLVLLSKMGIFQAEIERLTLEQLRKPSMKDALTGLSNRAQFLAQLERIIQYRHINRYFHFAVLFVDLDGFKPVNDTFGHKAGDAVLRHVGKLLQACVRKGDLVGRHGGDEFTVLLNDVNSPAEAARVAETILAKLRMPIDVGEPVVVGASIGIAMSTNLHDKADDLIRDADGAMYRAKAKGKNCYMISDQTDLSKAELQERWKRMVQTNWLAQSDRP